LLAKTVMVVATLCAFLPSRSQFLPQDQINWRTYRQGAFSNAKTAQTNVFETEGQFQRFWQNVIGTAGGKMPTDGVDWAREKLVAINLGVRPNAGYELSIQSIKRVKASEILVSYRERLPIQGVSYPQVQISPWIIVRMERAGGAINFQGRTVSGSIGAGGTVIFPPDRNDDGCCEPGTKCCSACGCGCQKRGGHGGRGGGN